MGSLRFDGVRYAVYSHDHEPAHVHAFYGEKEVVLDLLPQGGVILSARSEKKIKSNEVTRILRVARLRETQLRNLWRRTHGTRIDR